MTYNEKYNKYNAMKTMKNNTIVQLSTMKKYSKYHTINTIKNNVQLK